MAQAGWDLPVRYAVVGLGYFAQQKVLPSLAAARDSEIAALVSGDPEKCRRLAQEYQVAYEYEYNTFDDCLTNPDVDAIYIVLPNSLHEPYVMRAVEAGKHVLCEKPLASSAEAAHLMAQAAERAGVKLMVGYRMHFETTNQQLKRRIQAQEFGPIKQFYSSFTFNLSRDGWRLDKEMAGGGALVDIGIYALNNLCWLLEQVPVSVRAYTWSTDPKRFAQVEENITFQLTFSNGLEAQCMASYGAAAASEVFVGGEKGWMKLSQIYDYSDNPICQTYFSETDEVEQQWMTRNNEVQAEIEHFSHCIQFGKNPEPMGEEGYRDHRLMEALYQSARTGSAVQLVEESVQAGKATFAGAGVKTVYAEE